MASETIQFKTLNQLVQIQLDYISTNAPLVLSAPLVPFITALCYATALVGLVLQRLIQLVLDAARLSTSKGSDVDSFVLDYGLARHIGNKATGNVVFSRYVTAVSRIPIPLGSIVQTADTPPIKFVVIADSSNPAFQASLNAYFLNNGLTEVTVLVEAAESGVNGNVVIGTINKIGSSIAGIDNVMNEVPFTNGSDPESDAELKDRFALALQSLSRATMVAVLSAVENIQTGLIIKIYENLNIDGTAHAGQFVVLVDDGSGNPGVDLLSDIAKAVDDVRPVAVLPVVSGPVTTKIATAYIVIAYDETIVPDVLALQTTIVNNIVEYINKTSFLEVVRKALLYKAIWESVSPGDLATTFITADSTSSNVLFVASTDNLAVGQLVEVDGYKTASNVLPRIVAIDQGSNITISPQLLNIPPVGTMISAFTVKPGQIMSVNALEFGPQLTSFTSVAVGSGGYVGSAKKEINYSGVPGDSTRIYLTTVAGWVVNDPVILPGYQPNPATAVPDAATMKPIVKSIDNTATKSIIVQPALGKINSDGVWTELEPTAGTGEILAVGSTVYRTQYGAESLLSPSGGNLAQICRTTSPRIMVIMTPKVA